jgi:hypothetical protein
MRQEFLCWRHEQQGAEPPFRIDLDGRRFCSARTLQRPWPGVDLVRPRPLQQLPVVLRRREVRSLLALVAHPTARRRLQLSSACGLRLREGPPL